MRRRTPHAVDAVLCVGAGYAVTAVPLAVAGWFRLWLVLPCFLVATAAMFWLTDGGPAPVKQERSARLVGMATVAVVTAITVWNLANAGDHVLNDRDPGVYVTTGAWLERHGDLTVESTPGPFGDPDLVFRGETGIELVNGAGPALHYEGPGRFHIQFLHLWPAVLAGGAWVAGDTAYSAVPALVVGVALLVLYALTRRIVRPVLALVAVAAVGLSIPFANAARDAYSESLMMVFITGSIWVLVTGLEARSARRVALAGVLMGCATMTRIDAPAYLVGWTLVLAIATIRRHDHPDGRWWQQRGLPAVVVATGAVIALGFADTALRSRFYLIDHLDVTLPVVALVVVVVVASVLVTRRWTADASLHDWWLRRRDRLATVAAVVTGALVVAALVLRPAFTRDRMEDAPANYRGAVAFYQQAGGLEIDPTRTYWELSGHWLAWYLGWPLVLTACVGLVMAVAWIVRDRAVLALETAVLVGLPMLVLTVAQPSVVPDQPWAIRRFVPFSIPLVAILAVVVIDAVIGPAALQSPNSWGNRPVFTRLAPRVGVMGGWRRARLVAGSVLAVAVVAGTVWSTWPVRDFSPHDNERQTVRALCDAAGDDAALIVIEGREIGNQLAQPIRSLCGLPVVDAPGVITPGEVARFADAWAAEGRTLMLVAERPSQLALAGAAIVERFDLTIDREIERTLNRRPSALTAERQAVFLARPGG